MLVFSCLSCLLFQGYYITRLDCSAELRDLKRNPPKTLVSWKASKLLFSRWAIYGLLAYEGINPTTTFFIEGSKSDERRVSLERVRNNYQRLFVDLENSSCDVEHMIDAAIGKYSFWQEFFAKQGFKFLLCGHTHSPAQPYKSTYFFFL